MIVGDNMEDCIKIENLNNKYLKDINLTIKKNTFNTIIGPSGSGKTSLVKVIVGIAEHEGNIIIDNLELKKENLKKIRENVGIVLENVNDTFIGETVKEDLMFTLENRGLEATEINNRIEEMAKLLKIEDLLDYSIEHLSGGEKTLVALANALIIKPQILILDNSFSSLDGVIGEKIFKFLKKQKNLTIINITTNVEECLYGENTIVMNDGKIIFSGSNLEVFSHDKKLKSIGIDIPFMIELSSKLKYYGLVDEPILDIDKMVNHLWK